MARCVVSPWNSSPPDTVLASGLVAFKGELDSLMEEKVTSRDGTWSPLVLEGELPLNARGPVRNETHAQGNAACLRLEWQEWRPCQDPTLPCLPAC